MNFSGILGPFISILFTFGLMYGLYLICKHLLRLAWQDVKQTRQSSKTKFSLEDIDTGFPAQTSNSKETPEIKLEVKAKQWFFTRAESTAFQTISQALDGQPFTVISKVRMLDLFLVPDGPKGNSTRNRLIQKHVDFVILSQPEGRPVLAIELDGASHNNAKQQARDAVKDAAFAQSGLKLVRIENGQVTQKHVLDLLKPITTQKVAVH